MVRGHQRLDGVSILMLEGLIEGGRGLGHRGDGLGIAGSRR